MSHISNTEQLRQWVSDLQTGLYINCVYCGHRYGPKTDEVPADALHQHVKECPEHPLAELVAACRVVMSRFPGCRVVHSSYPKGFTCLDYRERARDNPNEYGSEFRDEVLNTDGHLCDACLIQSKIGELVE